MSADLDALLAAAVAGVGGSPREGQQRMATAVERAVDTHEHLLVQAGTGTGKSLAYLVPALIHARHSGKPVVVATATLALQAQIVDRDLPRLAAAVTSRLGKEPTYALVKGRRNYVCVNKLDGGFPDEEDGLFGVGQVDAAAGRLGQEVVRVRQWAEQTESGDRDELVPGVSERAWRQVSVSAEECLGQKCPMVGDCFVEQAREAARDVDVIVTNHSFMAIDAFEGRQMLPEHDVLVIDEAHELTDRVTSTITDELTASSIAVAARRAGKQSEHADELAESGEILEQALAAVEEGRFTAGIPDVLGVALARVRDTARAVQSDLKPQQGQEADAGRQVARAAVDDVFDTACRLLEDRELDVAWLRDDPRRGKVVHVAPMSVAMLVRDKVFAERTVVVTSATLELGGSFDAVARTIGLTGESAPAWSGLDVGSPFDYQRQGIAYVATALPAPGRDGTPEVVIDEIEALVRAAGGRTLGLFSSMRAAQNAAEQLRARLGDTQADGVKAGDGQAGNVKAGAPIEILCQGEDQIATLVRQFAREPATCLFGTMSLWQGVDVPGSSCQLVIIDRIPFPRPDDPLASARTQAIARMGGNGFMSVSATHAALKLAQGAGRLIRRSDDRGVVAFLDSRMMTARYAGFLQRSLPPFWPTTDRALVLAALERLDETAPPPVPVAEPALRGLTGARVDSTAPAAATTVTAATDGVEHPAPAAGPTPTAPSARTAVTDGVGWTAELDEELRDGVESGVEPDELADHLDLPVEAVVARIEQLDLGGTLL